jgi:diguanylate cyclase (GGDEF)-like protein
LTGLPNRRAFDTNFKLEFDRAKRHKNNLTLLMCDIDYFKLYNDFFGHPQGDECLKQVAKVLQETFNRAGELATRYGGEEFAIILPSINRAEAEKQAQRLINNLEHRQIPHVPESVRPYVTMSIGIAQLSAKQDLDNYHTLLEAADDALYKAKENGRNQLAWAIEEE